MWGWVHPRFLAHAHPLHTCNPLPHSPNLEAARQDLPESLLTFGRVLHSVPLLVYAVLRVPRAAAPRRTHHTVSVVTFSPAVKTKSGRGFFRACRQFQPAGSHLTSPNPGSAFLSAHVDGCPKLIKLVLTPPSATTAKSIGAADSVCLVFANHLCPKMGAAASGSHEVVAAA